MTNGGVAERVHQLYWDDGCNCATAMLKILAERRGLVLQGQVLDAAAGLHGAGGFGAQCGLVEGALVFLGVWGRAQGWPPATIVLACRNFAESFTSRFGSLICRELRPQGFSPQNPPHLCEALTRDAVEWAISFMEHLDQEETR